jgi:BirA family biotin operon repressor/biotin-[acetyl-CoA-carboxylase] ligase
MVASDFDTDLQKKATSLLIEAGHDFDTSEVLDAFLNVFKRLYAEWLQAGSLEPFVDRLHDESLLTGRRVELNVGNRKVSGIVRGVAKTGELLLESDDGGIKAFSSGEARLLPVG